MAKVTKTTTVKLVLSEKEAQVLKAVLGQVKWGEGEGNVAREVYDALDDGGIDTDDLTTEMCDDCCVVKSDLGLGW